MFEQMAALGIILAILGFFFQATLGIASGRLGAWLLSNPIRQELLQRVVGVTFAALAVRLLLTNRQ